MCRGLRVVPAPLRVFPFSLESAYRALQRGGVRVSGSGATPAPRQQRKQAGITQEKKKKTPDFQMTAERLRVRGRNKLLNPRNETHVTSAAEIKPSLCSPSGVRHS